jgi:hypothetical protein
MTTAIMEDPQMDKTNGTNNEVGVGHQIRIHTHRQKDSTQQQSQQEDNHTQILIITDTEVLTVEEVDNSAETDTEDLASVEMGTTVEADTEVLAVTEVDTTEVPAVTEVDTMEDPAVAEEDTMVEADTMDKDGEEATMVPETEEEEEEAMDLETEGLLLQDSSLNVHLPSRWSNLTSSRIPYSRILPILINGTRTLMHTQRPTE